MSPKKTSQPKLHTMFAVQAGGRTEPLEVDVCKLFKEAVLTGEVDNIIKKAFEYCQVELQGPPLGHASPVRPMADLLSFAGQDTSRSGLTSTIFGGCLHHVALATHAIGQSTDVGKVGKLLEGFTSATDLKVCVGVLIVNLETMGDHESEKGFLTRAHKDPEITAACLVVYFHREAATVVKQALRTAACDIVFDGRCLGNGTEFECHKLRLIEKEEQAREVLGLSSRRKCLFLVHLVNQCKKENKTHCEDKHDADVLRSVMEANHLDLRGWNHDTLRRYLSIGRRIADLRFTKILDLWEYHEQRNTLVDNITVLRCVLAVCNDNDELEFILKTLFLEQRCGLRRKLDKKTTSTVVRGLLLRRATMLHLSASYPRFADELAVMGPWSYYAQLHGCSEQGVLDVCAADDASHDQEEEEDGATQPDPQDLSSYSSRKPLLFFAKSLMRNRYERTFMSMAREGEKEKGGSDRLSLNLTLASAATLQRQFTAINGLYKVDFPVEETTVPDDSDAKDQVVHQLPGSSDAVTVVLCNAIKDEATYRERLERFNQEVAEFTAKEEKSYVNQRVNLHVMEEDNDKLVSRLQRLPVLSNEHKRKLYMYDEHVARPFDWRAMKRSRKTVFHPRQSDFDQADLDLMLDVYMRTRTQQGDTCQDLITVLLPAAPPNSAENEGAKRAVQRLRQLSPRHQRPKIGTVERSHVDVLRQTRERSSFIGNVDSTIIFTRQGPINIGRKTMMFCEGDTYFNRWRVKSIPYQQLPCCKEAVIGKLWRDEAKVVAFVEDDEIPHEEAMAHEVAANEEIVPYPHELSMQLTQELIRVFDVECMVLFTVGSGVALKACIERNIRAVGICDTKEHRQFVMQNLFEWVHTQNLVNMANAPKKPQELTEYEKQLGTKVGQQSPATTPVKVNASQIPEASPGMTAAIIPSPASKVTAMPPKSAGGMLGFGSTAL